VDDRALADRLVNYADALAAISFVGASGLSLALADPDVRCSLVTGGLREVSFGNLGFGIVMSGLIWMLRRWELDLRDGESISIKARRYAGRLYAARHIVVWLSAVAAVGILFAATQDTSCLG